MTEQMMNNKWFPCGEVQETKPFKPHDWREISFRQAHGDSQNIAVAETESFEEHNEKMKAFSRFHRLKTQPDEPNKRGDPEDLAALNAARIEKGSAEDTYPVAKNRRLHLVPGCMLPRHRLSLN